MLTEMPKRDDRLFLAPLGEQYEDLLLLMLSLLAIPSLSKGKVLYVPTQAKETLHRGRC
jgi:hypothetical protein